MHRICKSHRPVFGLTHGGKDERGVVNELIDGSHGQLSDTMLGQQALEEIHDALLCTWSDLPLVEVDI